MPSILITGGARSGKSGFAQEMALKSCQAVLFVATATAGDEEMAERIAQHRRDRPAGWSTLEVATGLGDAIRRHPTQAEVVIVDCITMLVNNIFGQSAGQGEQIDAAQVEAEVTSEIEGLVECIRQVEASFIIVTNELGSGLVPPDPVSRLYRDLLGRANQRLAGVSDEVYMMVSGIPVRIKP